MADPNSRAGTTYWTPAIDTYLSGLFAAEDESMHDAVRAASEAGMPSIQVSPTDGRIIEVLLRLSGARKVIEIGTLSGYSGLWIARALPVNGRLWTIEANEAHAAVAEGVFNRAGYADRVEVLRGPALSILPTLEEAGPFDAVFVDADKENYPAYAEWAVHHLRRGGLLLGDNTYLFGNLVGVEPANARQATDQAAMRAFHEVMAQAFHGVCLPTPDGLSVGIRH
jgi:caffeoyl-CoA O-methyltransferase